MLKIIDLQYLKIYLCVRNTIPHTITVSSVRGLGAMYRNFNERPLPTAVDINWTTVFTFIFPQNPKKCVWKSVKLPLGVLQIRHKSGCSTTLYGLTAVCVSLALFAVLMMTNRKKRLCQSMFLFNRKLVHVTTVSGKGEGKIYTRNDLEEPEGSRDIALLLL